MMPPETADEDTKRYSGRPFAVFLILLLLMAGGFNVARSIRQERFALVRLQYRIDAAAAPGEIVLLDDRRIAFELKYGTPSSLRVPVVVMERPEDALGGHDEIILVAAVTDPALTRLRSEGYGVQPDTMAVPGNLYASRSVMVFFVTAPVNRDGKHRTQ